MTAPLPARIDRRHDLDALRAVAMLLGILLHALMSFVPMAGGGWPIQDVRQHEDYDLVLSAIHGFRMPLFFLISGFFTAMLWRKRGLGPLIVHRLKRIFLPMVLGTLTIVPVVWFLLFIAPWLFQSASTGSADADYWSAVRQNDVETVEQSLVAGRDPNARNPGSGATPLAIAAVGGHVEMMQTLTASGADPDCRSRDGSTPLHAAAFFGREQAARLLIDLGATTDLHNRLGETPLDSARTSLFRMVITSGVVEQQVDFEQAIAGREQIVELLEQEPADRDPLDQRVNAMSPAVDGDESSSPGTSSDAEVSIAGLLVLLIYFPFFVHLWFLWYLCWLVAAFAIYAKLAEWFSLKIPSRIVATPWCLIWLLPLTYLPQSAMGTLLPTFGPDTASGLVPLPEILAYYAIFFFFGAWYFDADDQTGRLSRHWIFTIVLSILVIFPLGLEMTTGRFGWSDGWLEYGWYRPASVLLQVLYVWLMSFGLMGAFRHFYPTENKTMRYLSDSSYWLYLAHLPLIMVGQLLVRDWPMPSLIKLTLITVTCSLILLASYQWLVRYTPLGTLLNGPRRRVTTISTATAAVVEQQPT